MIRVQEAHLPVVADTHEGMKGKNNEDSFAVSAFQISEKEPIPVLLGVLSDGIGGHRAGEVASSIAVNVISDNIARSDCNQPVHILKDAVKQANSEIYNQSLEKERQGMGATLSIVFIVDCQLYTATIGDSRIYLIRDQAIHQLSMDHTWIQEALDAGLLTPEQAVGHPNAHVIRRYLGGPKAPDVDIRMKLTGKETDAEAEANQGMLLKPGDYLLQCSDGLTDLVEDTEILDIVTSQPMEQAIRSLIDTANARGGHDNTTIIITHVPSDFESHPRKVKTSRIPTIWLGCLSLFVFLVIILAIVWFFILRPSRQPLAITNPTTFPINLPAATLTGTSTAIQPTAEQATEEPQPTVTTPSTEESVQANLPDPQHNETITSLSWSQDISYLASSSIDGDILVWNTSDGSLAHRLPTTQSGETAAGIISIAWNPANSQHIASGATDGTILIWDVEKEKSIQQIESENAAVNYIAWKPDSTWLAAGYIDGTVVLWNSSSGAFITSRQGEGVSIQSIAWRSDGNRLALAYRNGTIRIWDLNTDEMLPDLVRPLVSANRLVYSIDGKSLVGAYSDGNISVWDMEDFGSSTLYPPNHDDAIVALAWKYHHNQFASGSIDGKIVIWDADSDEVLSSIQLPNNSVSTLVWHPDGIQLASGSVDGRIIIWDVDSGQPASNTPVLPTGEESSTAQPGSNAPPQGQSSPGTQSS